MYILLIMFAILCVTITILDIKKDHSQQKTLERVLDFCNKLSEEKNKLLEKICDQDEKNKSRDKFISIITKQLNKERAERKDIENNLEFVTSNIEDEKLKEVLAIDRKIK